MFGDGILVIDFEYFQGRVLKQFYFFYCLNVIDGFIWFWGRNCQKMRFFVYQFGSSRVYFILKYKGVDSIRIFYVEVVFFFCCLEGRGRERFIFGFFFLGRAIGKEQLRKDEVGQEVGRKESRKQKMKISNSCYVRSIQCLFGAGLICCVI